MWQSVLKCRWRCVSCSSQGYYTPKCTNTHKQPSLRSNLCEVKRAAGHARHTNINKPAAVISGLSHFLSHHLVPLWKPGSPADFFWCDVWVQVCIKKDIHACLSVLCVSPYIVRQSEKHDQNAHRQTHTSGSIQNAWNSSPAWFTLLPEPPYRTTDQLNHSTKCLPHSPHKTEGVVWQAIELKPSLKECSKCKWPSSTRPLRCQVC